MRKRTKQPMKVVHPHCAGIDVGSREHWVAVDPDRTDKPVRGFTTYSDDLQAMAQWLRALGVKTVAMEATGVYWIALFEVLDRAGFDVHLVDSRATKQVSGRKSDVLDCQWIRQLMAFGLLRSAFRPADGICVLRSLVRQRCAKVEDQARCLSQMHKALAQMNVQLQQVVSNLSGKTGMAILQSIVAGERNPQVLARLRDSRLRADEGAIARSLQGNWREEHLFALKQALDHHAFLEAQIHACDQAIHQALLPLASSPEKASAPVKPLRSPHRNAREQADLHRALHAMFGVDLTAIPTIAVDTVLVLAGEIGPDLSRFPTMDHFCSWLGLAPPTRISGGKPLSGKARHVHNRAGQALRQCALNARRSETFIGAAHRARLARMDKAQAVKATAHQLARLIYHLLTQGQAYVERGIAAFEAQRQERQLAALKRKANKLGLSLIASTTAQAATG